MEASYLKKKYPLFWETVYNKVLHDLFTLMPKPMVDAARKDIQKGREHSGGKQISPLIVAAYNAAFIATLELHRSAPRKRHSTVTA
jgi:hypothetical protein